ncbi:MAG: patatin-like phospholipase family protein [Thermodesulfobacteriota bacterium]
MKSRNIVLLLLVTLISCGCASYPVNPSLNKIDTAKGYRFENLAMNQGNSDETFIILALSGGGTRAAAFSYGAIKELSTIKLPGGGASLLDEVDIISSVSGGSFASAYYGLHGKETFLANFPKDVLSRKIQNGIILRILAPWNWWHLGSWYYGRSDLADSYYGKKIFNKATFKDLPRQRPFIMMNSTDIGIGARFSFIQDHFDRLCSDLDQISISRGVTASSAFPVAFTPLTFKNYPKEKCGYKAGDWLENAKNDLELNASRYDRALDWESYENSKRPYIHLSDGGLSDNLGLRGPVLGLIWNSSPLSIHRKFNNGKIKRIVVIAVDAQPKQPSKRDRSSHPPGIFNVLNAAASTPMENYSSDSIEQVRSYIENFNNQFKDAGEKPPVKFYFSRVTFEAEKDPQIRRKLQKIKTKLQLPKKKVDLLVEAGGRLLRQSSNFQSLLDDLGITQ